MRLPNTLMPAGVLPTVPAAVDRVLATALVRSYAHRALGAGTSTSPSWPQSVKCSPSACCCIPEQV